MRKVKITIISCLLIFISCDKKKATLPEASNLKSLLEQTVEQEKMPGLMAAIADENGLRELESAGVRAFGSDEPMTDEDLFHLGSCTKAMTSMLLAILVEDSLLNWESTLIEIFPELKEVIHVNHHEITLHELVTHRAGVRANAADWWAFQNLPIMDRRVELIKVNLESAGDRTRGEYHYSNLGYMIAGSMAEKVTGTPWEELMEEHLFGPLGMENAGFGPPGNPGAIDQPLGHNRDNGKWKSQYADNAEALGPAGRVHSSFEDWAKFVRVFMADGGTDLIQDESLTFLITPVGDYAAGWNVLDRSWAQGPAYNHSGSNTMWYVILWVAPELNRAYMVGTNSVNDETFTVLDQLIGWLITHDQSPS